ncbi:MAG: folate family ECF transporter S component [Eubacteriaceae bacterium]|nr:folate family ECF transporter S component [Eubacteriaceae bacterium]
MNKKSFTVQLVVMAFMIALEIILTRFLSINTPILRIGFGFVPVAMLGIMYGPLWAGAAYAVGDLIGAALFPTGAFFPGFTATAFLTGMVYGSIMHKKKASWKRALAASAIVVLILNLCLDTFWLSILMGNGVLALIPVRLIKAAVMLPVETVMITLVWQKVIPRIPFLRSVTVKQI